MSLQTRLTDLVTAVATDYKQLRTWITGSSSGNLSGLTTTNKADLISAINELNAKPSSGVTQADLTNLKTEILGAGVPAALDTLDELAAALGDDANYAASTTTALGNRVRVDAAQAFTAPQQAQGRANIAAQDSASIGNPDADLVAAYTAAKA